MTRTQLPLLYELVPDADYIWPLSEHFDSVEGISTPSVQVGSMEFMPGKFGNSLQTTIGATNLIENPVFEIDTSGWSPYSLSTIHLHTAESYVGSNCMRVEGASAQNKAQCASSDMTITPGESYTLSAFVKNISIPSGGTIALEVYWQGGASGDASTVSVLSVTSDDAADWLEISNYFEPDQPDRTSCRAYIIFYNVPTDGLHFLVDGVQFAQGRKKALANGNFATHSWSGSANSSQSVSSPSQLQYNVTASNKFTIAFWIKMPSVFNGEGTYAVDWVADTSNRIIFYRNSIDTDGLLRVFIIANGVVMMSHTHLPYGEIDSDIWRHIAIMFSTNLGTKMYVDGRLSGSSPTSSTWATAPFTLSLGSRLSQLRSIQIRDVIVVNKIMKVSEVKSIFNAQHSLR